MSKKRVEGNNMRIPRTLQGRTESEVKPAKARRPRKGRVEEAAPSVEFGAVETKAPAATETAEPVEAAVTNGDSLQLYLREIGQVKLLTPAEEIGLAKRIKKGDKSAREHMIKANLL